MLDIGLSELLIILAVALIVLGPKKLPEVARSLGRGLAQFRRASEDLRRSILAEDDHPERDNAPETLPYSSAHRRTEPVPESTAEDSSSDRQPTGAPPEAPASEPPAKKNGIEG